MSRGNYLSIVYTEGMQAGQSVLVPPPTSNTVYTRTKHVRSNTDNRREEGGGTKEEDLMTLIRKQGSCGDVRRRCAADASLEKEGWG